MDVFKIISQRKPLEVILETVTLVDRESAIDIAKRMVGDEIYSCIPLTSNTTDELSKRWLISVPFKPEWFPCG